MSIQAVAWVLEHSPARLTDRLVLISIANHAGTSPVDGAWEAWPGVDTIALEAGLDRTRTVQESLARLIADGALERVVNGAPDDRIRGDRRPNLYRILTRPRGDAPPHPVPDDGVTPPRTPQETDGVPSDDTPEAPRGDASRHDGVTPHDITGCRGTAPEPSVEPSFEPPPQPPALAPTPDDDPSGGSTIDQQPEHPPALTGDQRRARIHEANVVIAERLARHHTGLVKPHAWIATVAERLDGEHATEGHRLLAEYPDLTPVALADLLDRGPDTDTATARARQRQAEEDTHRRIRDVLVQDVDRHRNLDDIARLRSQLHLPKSHTA